MSKFLLDALDLFRQITAQPRRLPDPCPVCKEALELRQGSSLRICKNGHFFSNRRRVGKVLNEGDHHGNL